MTLNNCADQWEMVLNLQKFHLCIYLCIFLIEHCHCIHRFTSPLFSSGSESKALPSSSLNLGLAGDSAGPIFSCSASMFTCIFYAPFRCLTLHITISRILLCSEKKKKNLLNFVELSISRIYLTIECLFFNVITSNI